MRGNLKEFSILTYNPIIELYSLYSTEMWREKKVASEIDHNWLLMNGIKLQFILFIKNRFMTSHTRMESIVCNFKRFIMKHVLKEFMIELKKLKDYLQYRTLTSISDRFIDHEVLTVVIKYFYMSSLFFYWLSLLKLIRKSQTQI